MNEVKHRSAYKGMDEAIDTLIAITPSKFVFACCDTRMDAMLKYKNMLPLNHKRNNGRTEISIEATESFKKLFPYSKVDVFPSKKS